MLISVVVCTYNRCESLRHTLQALQRQVVTDEPGPEILVVDNHSTDQTKAVVHEAARDCAEPSIRYLFEPRQGLSFARNRGIQEAKGEIIAFTDDDVRPEPGLIRALLEVFAATQADCAGGKILPLWLQPPPAWLVQENLRPNFFGRLAMLNRGNEVIVADVPDANFLYGGNMAFRKDALQEVGFFRTDLGPAGAGSLRLLGDDTEMIRRFFEAGKRMVYTPNAVVYHAVPAKRMRMLFFRQRAFQEGVTTTRMAVSTERRIPPWFMRVCVSDGLQALWAYARRDRARGVKYELSFWSRLGRMVGATNH